MYNVRVYMDGANKPPVGEAMRDATLGFRLSAELSITVLLLRERS